MSESNWVPVTADVITGFLDRVNEAIGQCVDHMVDFDYIKKERKVSVEIQFVPDPKARPGEAQMPDIRVGVKVSLPSNKAAGMAGRMVDGQLLVNPWCPESPDQMVLENVTKFSKDANGE